MPLLLSLLSNWRVWAALFFVVAQAVFGWKIYSAGEAHGEQKLVAYQLEMMQKALVADEANRAKEKAKDERNQKVTEDYDSLKTATATAIGALDADRMRLMSDLAAARGTGANSATSTGIDATAEDAVLGGCLQRYEEVAGDAKAAANQIIGLQNYINTVVLKP
jgi:hypothetical protein